MTDFPEEFKNPNKDPRLMPFLHRADSEVREPLARLKSYKYSSSGCKKSCMRWTL